LKLAPLFAKYLVIHKRLDLPGIGSFLLHEPAYPEPEHHKHDKPAGVENVSFESNTAVKISPDLIQFIAAQTGKIKALASADLESYLTQAQQFLNIGNPFLFEGIGILEKLKSGEYALTAGTSVHEKTKDYVPVEKPDSPDSGEFRNDYKKIFYSGKVKMKLGNPIVIILVIAGLAFAVWGGYSIYKKTIPKNKPVAEYNNKIEEPGPVKDSVMFQKDSAVVPAPITTAVMKKFILEVCNAKRAYERYGKLKAFLWNVQLETKDSVTYKLFLVLPASASDSSHIIDSLSLLNGRRVYIE
jgi:hypothetical protein